MPDVCYFKFRRLEKIRARWVLSVSIEFDIFRKVGSREFLADFVTILFNRVDL